MDNNILILSEGMQTSIQDLGRKGYRAYGVPIAGAMDKYSAILANKLLNNDEKLPVMEMTYTGPKILFEDATLLVITGADMSPKINDKPIKMNVLYEVKTSDVLSFGKLKSGARTYLGVKGGFLTEKKLDSYSFYEGITSQSRVNKGDRLRIENYEAGMELYSSKIKVKRSHFEAKKLEVTKGPEFHRLTKKHREYLFSKQFKIGSLNDRMGCQLKNKFPPIKDYKLTIKNKFWCGRRPTFPTLPII